MYIYSVIFAVELVLDNVDKLCALLEDVDYHQFLDSLIPLTYEIRRISASEFRQEMLSWLEKENPKPSWNALTSALTRIGHYDKAADIAGMPSSVERMDSATSTVQCIGMHLHNYEGYT